MINPDKYIKVVRAAAASVVIGLLVASTVGCGGRLRERIQERREDQAPAAEQEPAQTTPIPPATQVMPTAAPPSGEAADMTESAMSEAEVELNAMILEIEGQQAGDDPLEDVLADLETAEADEATSAEDPLGDEIEDLLAILEQENGNADPLNDLP